MSATNKTANLELPQYIGSDKPTYLGDWNETMGKIDNFAGTVEESLGDNGQMIEQLQNAVSHVQSEIVTQEAMINVVNASLTEVENRQSSQQSSINKLNTDVSALETRVGGLDTSVGGLTSQVSLNVDNINGLTTRVGANETNISGLDIRVTALEGGSSSFSRGFIGAIPLQVNFRTSRPTATGTPTAIMDGHWIIYDDLKDFIRSKGASHFSAIWIVNVDTRTKQENESWNNSSMGVHFDLRSQFALSGAEPTNMESRGNFYWIANYISQNLITSIVSDETTKISGLNGYVEALQSYNGYSTSSFRMQGDISIGATKIGYMKYPWTFENIVISDYSDWFFGTVIDSCELYYALILYDGQ